MGELDDKFFKVICEEVDVFGKQIHIVVQLSRQKSKLFIMN